MSGGIWAPYKELASVVNHAILKKQPDAFYSLEAILKKHKTDFISLLKNPVREYSYKHVCKWCTIAIKYFIYGIPNASVE